MGEFDGKVAIITGAGRMRGIGRATAISFAERGADVVVTGTGRDPSTFPADEQAAGWRDVESVAEEVRSLGRRALPLKVDVSDGAQVQAMVDRTVDDLGRIDFLVNNAAAGRTGGLIPLAELPEETWRHVIDVKLTGTYLCTRAVLRVLLRQEQGGSVINVSTVEAKRTPVNDSAYATASAALYTLNCDCGQRGGPAGHPGELRISGYNGHRPERYYIRLPTWGEMGAAPQVHPPGQGRETERDRQFHHLAL